MKIIPAILTENISDANKFIEQTVGFTDEVMVDFMDGDFVPSTSITPEESPVIPDGLKAQAHIMVQNPEKYIHIFAEKGYTEIAFHLEAKGNVGETLNRIENEGLKSIIAINPDTSYRVAEEFIDRVRGILFLGVYPGYYGRPFQEKVLAKIRDFKSDFPHKIAAIDGGIKLKNIKEINESGLDIAYVGSAIFLTDDPAKAHRNFLSAIE